MRRKGIQEWSLWLHARCTGGAILPSAPDGLGVQVYGDAIPSTPVSFFDQRGVPTPSHPNATATQENQGIYTGESVLSD